MQMCGTEVSGAEAGTSRQRRQTDGSGSVSSGSGTNSLQFLTGPVQFIVVGIGNTSANTHPELQLPSEPLFITEDTSISDYQLYYTDMERDEVEFYVASPPQLGNASLTLDGLLSYTPCSHCTGLDSFEILIIEKPFGFNMEPLTAYATLLIEIENVNDRPYLYAYDTLSETETDVTESTELNVVIESNRTGAVSVAQIVAFDVDGHFDDLSISVEDGESGTTNAEVWLDIVSVFESFPITSVPDQNFIGYLSFLAANITYQPLPDFTGPDTITVIARDTNAGFSDSLTVRIEVVPSWCLNDGVCNGSEADPTCGDLAARRASPENYTCQCLEGFSGIFCELDMRTVEPVETRGVYVLYVCTFLRYCHLQNHSVYVYTCHAGIPHFVVVLIQKPWLVGSSISSTRK